jgi:hypothetical protein
MINVKRVANPADPTSPPKASCCKKKILDSPAPERLALSFGLAAFSYTIWGYTIVYEKMHPVEEKPTLILRIKRQLFEGPISFHVNDPKKISSERALATGDLIEIVCSYLK